MGNNFYFTMDQGLDSVAVREIWFRGQIPLKGPPTGIEGFYTGPLWYWLKAPLYILSGGHPFAGVFLLILLNVTLTGILAWKLAKKISPGVGLIVGFSLQFFWWFYDTSRYAFHPFLLVFLAGVEILLLIDFLEGQTNRYWWAAVPVGLVFHTEMAVVPIFVVFYLLVGIWTWWRRQINWKILLFGLMTVGLFLLPHLVSELTSGFVQAKALQRQLLEPAGVYSQTSFRLMSSKFAAMIVDSVIPQNSKLALPLALIIILFLVKRKIGKFTRNFVILSLTLFLLSWLWFSTNKGWQTWHIVYLPTLLFISILLLVFSLPGKIRWLLWSIIFIAQAIFFLNLYLKFLHLGSDPSLLKNELGAIDWVYQKSKGQGFYVYNYLPSVLDYPYQYLFWWWGRQKYGYVPCEYSSFPGTPNLFIPGEKYYQTPQRECSQWRFLIIEPDKNLTVQSQWLAGTRRGTKLLEETNIGRIRVEKRLIF